VGVEDGWRKLAGELRTAAEEGTSDDGVSVPRKGKGLAGEVPWVEAKLWRGSGEEELRWSGELDANRSGGEGWNSGEGAPAVFQSIRPA